MTYTVRPVTQFALMRDGQAAPVAIYGTALEAQAAAAMLAEHRTMQTPAKPYLFSDWAKR